MTLREQYEQYGYVVVPTNVNPDMLYQARDPTGPLQPEGYHWSDGPRVFEGWKSNSAVRHIAWSEAIRDAISEVTGEEGRPFQTISFSKGTNQALHQDGIHFQTLPLGKIVGVWVALEDCDDQNGTLCVVPGSHKQGFLNWSTWFDRCEPGQQFEFYAAYEKLIGEGMHAVPVNVPAGHAVIWGTDLLHGGWPIVDNTKTRHSLAVHYFLDGARIGWAPMFSDTSKFDFYFKRTRWFDKSGSLHESHESPDVGLFV